MRIVLQEIYRFTTRRGKRVRVLVQGEASQEFLAALETFCLQCDERKEVAMD